jgi:beta-N-acetylhexosaminidase
MVGADNYSGRVGLLALTNAIKDQVARVKHVQPLLMAVQQGGDFSALPGLPPGAAPADVGSSAEAGRLAGSTGRTLESLGLNAIFAPSLEVAPSDAGAMGTRAFSDIPGDVAAYATATVPAYAKAGVLAAAGRFPGLGAAQQAPEDGPANVGLTLDELRARDIVPFRAAIRAGIPAIVVGSGLYVTDDFVVPASNSRTLVSSVLRGQLGFRGLVLSDDLTEPAITSTMKPPDAAVGAIVAGVDMVYVSGDDAAIKSSYDALLAAAKSGKIKSARIDDALTHVLVAKASGGLLKPRKVAQKATTPGG